jgi:hypothetical protein
LSHRYANPPKRLDTSESVNLYKCLVLLDSCRIHATRRHYEGRGWRGFHHHATLCVAAHAFLIAERARIPPSVAGGAADKCATAGVPQNRQPRGAAGPSRTTRRQLDRDNAPTPDRRPHNHPGAMSLLQRIAQNYPRHSSFMTQ